MSLEGVFKSTGNLSVQIDNKALMKHAEDEAKKAAFNAMHRIINLQFAPRGSWGVPEGEAHKMCVAAVEAFILSDEFAQIMQNAARQHATTAANEAILTLLKSKSKKVLFSPDSL